MFTTCPPHLRSRILSQAYFLVLSQREIHYHSSTSGPQSIAPTGGVRREESLEPGTQLESYLRSNYRCNVTAIRNLQWHLSWGILFTVHRRESSMGICWVCICFGQWSYPASMQKHRILEFGEWRRDGCEYLHEKYGACEQRLHWNMQAAWICKWFDDMDGACTLPGRNRCSRRNKCAFPSLSWPISRWPISRQNLRLTEIGERLYSVFGNTISHIYVMGLHRDNYCADVPFFLSETRKRVLAVMHKSDKISSMHFGRPPRLQYQYCDFALPLDLADDQLFLDEKSLEIALRKLDDEGWNSQGQFYPATVIRMRHIVTTLGEKMLGLTLGSRTASYNNDLL